jgi:hypothetical protein
MAWQCGRCQQEEMLAQGKKVGRLLPEHHRTCPKRTTPPPAGPVIERVWDAEAEAEVRGFLKEHHERIDH